MPWHNPVGRRGHRSSPSSLTISKGRTPGTWDHSGAPSLYLAPSNSPSQRFPGPFSLRVAVRDRLAALRTLTETFERSPRFFSSSTSTSPCAVRTRAAHRRGSPRNAVRTGDGKSKSLEPRKLGNLQMANGCASKVRTPTVIWRLALKRRFFRATMSEQSAGGECEAAITWSSRLGGFDKKHRACAA